MNLQTSLLALAMLATFSHPVCGGEREEGAKKGIESPSPDGRFAFRYKAGADAETKAYVLIGRQSGKVLARLADDSDSVPGPSGRFEMAVLWRPDSQAFALKATFWKRGSELSVWWRDGATFRKVKLPELLAEITDKAKGGEGFPHVVEVNSQSAKQWQKDGSLVVEIESMQDGNGSSITANRTVILGFGKSGKARILKSTIKFATEKQ